MTSLTRWKHFPGPAGWPFDFWSDYTPVRRASNAPFKLGVDVIQNSDNYTIEASLPGFDADERSMLRLTRVCCGSRQQIPAMRRRKKVATWFASGGTASISVRYASPKAWTSIPLRQGTRTAF